MTVARGTIQWVISAISALFFLSACTVLPTLKDGHHTTMTPANVALRDSLVIKPPLSPITVEYKPVSECVYIEHREDVLAGKREHSLTLKVRAVKNRLQIVYSDEKGILNTALIDQLGHLYDFNVVEPDNAGRYTPESKTSSDYNALHKAISAGASATGTHTMNPLTMILPEYITTQLQAGQVVAEIKDETGQVWGRFVFAGVTDYKGIQSAVLDLLKDAPPSTGLGPVSYGFNLVNLRNGLPLVRILEGVGSANDPGTHIKLEQTGCKG